MTGSLAKGLRDLLPIQADWTQGWVVTVPFNVVYFSDAQWISMGKQGILWLVELKGEPSPKGNQGRKPGNWLTSCDAGLLQHPAWAKDSEAPLRFMGPAPRF